jgi:hypothetical protein
MANLQKHRAHESLNVDTAAGWDVQTRLTISSAAHVYSDVSSVSQIGVHSDSIVYFRFDALTSDTISANNDLRIPADTLTFIKVPQGVGSTINVHFKQVTSAASKFLRIVQL